MPVIYSVPVAESDGVQQPAHADEHGADPANYSRHYRGATVYVASRVNIGTYDEYAADEASPVEAYESGSDEYAELDAQGISPPSGDGEE